MSFAPTAKKIKPLCLELSNPYKTPSLDMLLLRISLMALV